MAFSFFTKWLICVEISRIWKWLFLQCLQWVHGFILLCLPLLNILFIIFLYIFHDLASYSLKALCVLSLTLFLEQNRILLSPLLSFSLLFFSLKDKVCKNVIFDKKKDVASLNNIEKFRKIDHLLILGMRSSGSGSMLLPGRISAPTGSNHLYRTSSDADRKKKRTRRRTMAPGRHFVKFHLLKYKFGIITSVKFLQKHDDD